MFSKSLRGSGLSGKAWEPRCGPRALPPTALPYFRWFTILVWFTGREGCGSPGCCRLCLQALAHAHLDLLGPGFGALRQRDLQDALVIQGRDLVGVNRVGQAEGAQKRSIAALDALEVLFFFLFFKAALAFDRQSVVFKAQVQILLVDSRNFHLEDHTVLILVNIDRRRERAGLNLLFAAGLREVLKNGGQFAKRIDAGNRGHVSFPPNG